MKLQINLMVVMFAINASIATLTLSGVYPTKQPLWSIDPSSSNYILVSFTLPDLLSAGLLTLTGIFTIIVRQNVSAGLALIAWSMGFFLTATRWVLNGLPELLKLLEVPWYLVFGAQVFCGLIFWLFILEITTQRDMA